MVRENAPRPTYNWIMSYLHFFKQVSFTIGMSRTLSVYMTYTHGYHKYYHTGECIKHRHIHSECYQPQRETNCDMHCVSFQFGGVNP